MKRNCYIRRECNGLIHVRIIPFFSDSNALPKCFLFLIPPRANKLYQFYLGGGMPVSQNRTKWPIGGGAVSFQPGWFPGHQTAFLYINMGYGTIPPNMSHPMIAPFQIVAPTNQEYPGTFCIPQVPLPQNAELKVGDNATIQVVEIAQHGAALYNVRYSRAFIYFVYFTIIIRDVSK